MLESSLQTFFDFLLYVYTNKKILYTVLLTVLYALYYKKFRYYKFNQAAHYTRGKYNIGKTVPNYPNGWFRILGSAELSKGDVKYVNLHGENMAVFRGADGIVYALDAYCAHLGANLGVNGTVVHDRCIQCPFHAWVFDGQTGNCVIGKELKPKEAIRYEYVFTEDAAVASGEANNINAKNDPNFKCDNEQNSANNKHKKAKISITKETEAEIQQHGETCTLREKSKGIVNIRKFQVLERSGSIFIWFNASALLKFKETNQNETIAEFPYEPFDLTPFLKKLEYRGRSLNTVRCHVQDIAENGGDLLHFVYVHNELIPYILKGFWDAKWVSAADPELRSKIAVKNNEQFNKFRMDLVDRYINEKNKNYIGVITLENSIQIAGIPKQYGFFSLTGFQVGPGIVYLFINSPFFQVALMQYIESRDKHTQYVYHDIYASRYLPYFFSAMLLRMEASQVLNDGVVWDNKRFGINPCFNLTNPADNTLLVWRTWYSQFYKDCRRYEEEKKKENMDW